MTTATIQTGRTVNNTGLTGKERLLEALKSNAKPNGYIRMTTEELAKICHITDHEVVHFIREGLARQNLIRYRENKTGGLSNLKLTPIAMGTGYNKRIMKTPWFKKTFGDNPPQEILDSMVDVPYKRGTKHTPKITPKLVSEKPQISSPEKFPLIEAIANRRKTLGAAAKLAEQAGEEDIAITLMERAEAPLSPLETEVIALWTAYNSCKEGK